MSSANAWYRVSGGKNLHKGTKKGECHASRVVRAASGMVGVRGRPYRRYWSESDRAGS